MVQEYTSPQEVTQKAVDSTKQLSFAEAAQVQPHQSLMSCIM